jgi:cysteine-rich repeat protein
MWRISGVLALCCFLLVACGDDDSSGGDAGPGNDTGSGTCGDGVLDVGEQCDDGSNNSDSVPGACRTDCRDHFCGDGVVDTDEVCDGEELDGQDCAYQGFTAGALVCADDCSKFDTSECSFCGNDQAEGESDTDPNYETCDGVELREQTCLTIAYTTGILACNASCGWDITGCVICGDGHLDSGEECDEGVNNADTPNADCRLDCNFPSCGDDIVDDLGGEECDDGNTVDGDGCSQLCRFSPVALASGLNGPTQFAVGSAYVYWTNYSEGTVKRVPKAGGSVELLASGLVGPWAIAVDSTQIFWTDVGADPIGVPDTGTVTRMPLAGGTANTFKTGESNPVSVAVTSSYVYWSNDRAASSSVERATLTGTGGTVLVSGMNGASRIALDSTHIYWTSLFFDEVLKVVLAGGTLGDIDAVATGQNGPADIAVDSTHVYWTNYDSGEVRRAPIGGGSSATLASSQSSPAGIAVDAANIYWTSNGGGNVLQMPLSGGTVLTVASSQNSPTFIAEDSTHIYWLNNGTGSGDGSVMRVHK